jgi:phosphatidylserine/phosphatidylglycerophosphate/cardiolipin synthase-like enzyme
VEANADVALPAAIGKRLKFWEPELRRLVGTFAMVHSKVVVVDPFSDNCAVMTGSHNLGPKASAVNDENFLIFSGYRELAAAYATNIMAIYGHYRWRFRVSQQEEGARQFKGLRDNDRWQIDDRAEPIAGHDKRRKREIDFWFGEA